MDSIVVGEYPCSKRPCAGAILRNNCSDMPHSLPRGYLACDGSAVCRMKYYVLFGIIGTEYGEGDGHSTFHLPNLSDDKGNSYIIKYDTDSDINPYADPNVIPLNVGTYPPMERPSPGAVLAHPEGVLPAGYLVCDGSTVARDEYPVLFEVIGTEYGEGDGHTTFHIPKLHNEADPELMYIIKYDQLSDLPPYTDPNIIPLEIGEYPSSQTIIPGTILLNTVSSINPVPAGYLLCDGSEVSRHTYSMLFEIIGTRYGSGDGSTTFHVPNVSTECTPHSTYIIKYDLDSDEDPVAMPIEVAEYLPEEFVITGGIRASGIIPQGYVRCDGSEVSRHTYEALFDVIGTYYGEGDRHSTFHLPKLDDPLQPDIIYSIKYEYTEEPVGEAYYEVPCDIIDITDVEEICYEPCNIIDICDVEEVSYE
jgi:microcystin-dependent protein